MTTAEEKKPEVKAEAKPEPKSQRQLELEELRRERVPAGVPTLNIDFPKREGYRRRVVKDDPGRLDRFFDGGWRFVQKDEMGKPTVSSLKITAREAVDSCVTRVIGSRKDGSASTGFLMEIPEELYNEDQAMKLEKIDALEAGLRQGKDAEGQSGEGTYVPSTGIKIETKRGRRR